MANDKKIIGLDNKPLSEEEQEERKNEKPKFDPRLRHIGRFAISRQMLHNNFGEVQELMKEVVVVRAEMMYISDCVEYTAISPTYFRAVPEGEMAPGYHVMQNTETGFYCEEIES